MSHTSTIIPKGAGNFGSSVEYCVTGEVWLDFRYVVLQSTYVACRHGILHGSFKKLSNGGLVKYTWRGVKLASQAITSRF